MSLSAKPPKSKRCKSPECRQSFQPRNSMQVVCSPKCGLALAAIQRKRKECELAKLDRAQIKEKREQLKTRGDYTKEAQQAFNEFIRERDKDLPCISCGRHHQGQYHAGHYRSVGSSPELRFEPLNVHKQCAPCNNHKSGNVVEYRISLVKRIGVDKVEWLEGPHEPKRYGIEDLKTIKAHYRARVRDLKKSAQTH